MVFINRTSREITVPAGTMLSTATGNNVRFVTTARAMLAPNGRAAAPVEALDAGPAGNVRAGTVTRVEGPLGLSLLVANEANFSGGTTAQKGVVTEEDKVRLQEQLLEELKRQALERLNERVKGEGFIPPESVSFLALSPTFTPFVGEVSPDLYLSMSVQAVGLAADCDAATGLLGPGCRSPCPGHTIDFRYGALQPRLGACWRTRKTLVFTLTGEGTLLRRDQMRAPCGARSFGLPPAEAKQVLARAILRWPVHRNRSGAGLAAVCRADQAAGLALAHPRQGGLGCSGAGGDEEVSAYAYRDCVTLFVAGRYARCTHHVTRYDCPIVTILSSPFDLEAACWPLTWARRALARRFATRAGILATPLGVLRRHATRAEDYAEIAALVAAGEGRGRARRPAAGQPGQEGQQARWVRRYAGRLAGSLPVPLASGTRAIRRLMPTAWSARAAAGRRAMRRPRR